MRRGQVGECRNSGVTDVPNDKRVQSSSVKLTDAQRRALAEAASRKGVSGVTQERTILLTEALRKAIEIQDATPVTISFKVADSGDGKQGDYDQQRDALQQRFSQFDAAVRVEPVFGGLEKDQEKRRQIQARDPRYAPWSKVVVGANAAGRVDSGRVAAIQDALSGLGVKNLQVVRTVAFPNLPSGPRGLLDRLRSDQHLGLGPLEQEALVRWATSMQALKVPSQIGRVGGFDGLAPRALSESLDGMLSETAKSVLNRPKLTPFSGEAVRPISGGIPARVVVVCGAFRNDGTLNVTCPGGQPPPVEDPNWTADHNTAAFSLIRERFPSAELFWVSSLTGIAEGARWAVYADDSQLPRPFVVLFEDQIVGVGPDGTVITGVDPVDALGPLQDVFNDDRSSELKFVVPAGNGGHELTHDYARKCAVILTAALNAGMDSRLASSNWGPRVKYAAIGEGQTGIGQTSAAGALVAAALARFASLPGTLPDDRFPDVPASGTVYQVPPS